MKNLIRLDDYRLEWITCCVLFHCCGWKTIAVFKKNSKKLECPRCKKMTHFSHIAPDYTNM